MIVSSVPAALLLTLPLSAAHVCCAKFPTNQMRVVANVKGVTVVLRDVEEEDHGRGLAPLLSLLSPAAPVLVRATLAAHLREAVKPPQIDVVAVSPTTGALYGFGVALLAHIDGD